MCIVLQRCTFLTTYRILKKPRNPKTEAKINSKYWDVICAILNRTVVTTIANITLLLFAELQIFLNYMTVSNFTGNMTGNINRLQN